MEYVFEKYVTTKENLKETLVEYGVAIIPSVLNEDECDKMVSGQWDFFEHITKDWAIPLIEIMKRVGADFINFTQRIQC